VAREFPGSAESLLINSGLIDPVQCGDKEKNMYQLRKSVEAVRYSKGSEKQIAELGKRARPSASYGPHLSSFRIFNDGPEISIEPGQWLVKIGNSLMVIDDGEFLELFEPVG
jgi:hypothetical protein